MKVVLNTINLTLPLYSCDKVLYETLIIIVSTSPVAFFSKFGEYPTIVISFLVVIVSSGGTSSASFCFSSVSSLNWIFVGTLSLYVLSSKAKAQSWSVTWAYYYKKESWNIFMPWYSWKLLKMALNTNESINLNIICHSYLISEKWHEWLSNFSLRQKSR